MKSKKHLGLVSAVLGTCLAVTSFTAVSAFADDTNETTTTIVYTGNTKENRNTDRVFYQNPISEHFTVTKNGTASTLDTSKIDATKVKLLDADGNDIPDTAGVQFKYEKGTIMVNKAGTYVLSVDFTDDLASVGEVKSYIEVVDKATLSVSTDATKLGEFMTELNKEVERLNNPTGESADTTKEKELEIPDEIWNLINSNVYSAKDNGQILVKVYVASAGGSFSAVNSSFKAEMPDVKLSASGTYEFYFEVKDPDGNEIVKKSDYVQKTDGWYSVTTDDKGTADENDDEEVETLVLPIFKFNYAKEEKLEVSVKGGGENGVKGIVGQEYTSIEITSNGTDNEVYLYYSADNKSWAKATEEDATYGTLTTSSTSFTPLKKGYYKITVQAKGGADGFATDSDESDVIYVNREIQPHKLVNVKFRNFIKNNWLSVVFLGIAFLCVVGIIVLAFYKPKDANEVNKSKKADKVEDDVEVETADQTEEVEVADNEEVEETEEVETLEEAAEETAEEVEETEAVEETVEATPVETVEEVKVEETPAETVEEAKVEETPAETVEETPAEEVKNDGENA